MYVKTYVIPKWPLMGFKTTKVYYLMRNYYGVLDVAQKQFANKEDEWCRLPDHPGKHLTIAKGIDQRGLNCSRVFYLNSVVVIFQEPDWLASRSTACRSYRAKGSPLLGGLSCTALHSPGTHGFSLFILA